MDISCYCAYSSVSHIGCYAIKKPVIPYAI